MTIPTLQTRRTFLRNSVLGGALTWTVPSFIHMTMRSLFADSLNDAIQTRTGKDDTILVVLQLAGGNDGLNTVIPWNNDFYFTARPRLAIPAGTTLKLNDEIAFNPALTGLQEIWDKGQLAIIQGVGYPNPNRSHFRSMEIWQTASDAERFERHGWIGRYFDHQCAGEDVTVGVNVGAMPPQAFTSQQSKGITVPIQGARRVGKNMFMMGETEPEISEAGGSSIEGLGAASQNNPGERPLDFLERTALDAQVSSDRIDEVLRQIPATNAYPASRLGRDLEMVGRLIAGGMGTRIYYVSLGGFDTHANQAGAHDRLLRELGDGVAAFTQHMESIGQYDRVALLTFSEFGRRVAENANAGTDHGAAAPVFVAGGAVQGGIYEKMPSLDPNDLQRGDLKFNVDFRSIYATLLERHLKAPSAPILGRAFTPVEFMS